MPPDVDAHFLRHGSPRPLPERIPLRAGPLTLFFEEGELRTVRLGRIEVIRRIYGAVRDRHWGTVPGTFQDLSLQRDEAGFVIQFTLHHLAAAIEFVWQGEIVGTRDGSLSFRFAGEARTTFFRNRIGLCVLHPIRECAGARCRVGRADGSGTDLVFPEVIAAEQPIPGFHDLTSLGYEIQPGLWAELSFFGDQFETEDQRNWIDASFKTFCTPLRLPFPVEIRAGTRVQQEVRFRLRGPVNETLKWPVAVHDGPGSFPSLIESGSRVEPVPARPARPLPLLGLGQASHGKPLTPKELRLLSVLHLAHLRVDLHSFQPTPGDQLTRARHDAEGLKTGWELALHLETLDQADSIDAFLDTLLSRLKASPIPVRRLLVFGGRRDRSTPNAALVAVRRILGGLKVPVGVGTNADLYQFNLQRPPTGADFVCWSMNPQVHAFDCSSLAETPEAAAHQLRSMQQYVPGTPLVVSPITLKPRFNPLALGPEAENPLPDTLPSPVDARQRSLFGAAWTVGMLKALAENGAASVTFFETTGWRGVMESAAGSPLPEYFPSRPGEVFPLFHVLADVAEFTGGESIATRSDDEVAALLLRRVGPWRLLLANLGASPRRVQLDGLPRFTRLRRLDEDTAALAATDPFEFRGHWQPHAGDTLTLPAFGFVTLE